MDLDRLSNEILHQIILHLPFKDRIRVARVSRRFNELSQLVISETKTFNLTAPIFQRIPCESMKELINSCADHLEKIIYKTTSIELVDQDYASVVRERLQFVLSVSFPNLSIVSVDTCFRDSDWRLCELLRQFLIDHPNIRVMEWEEQTLRYLMTEVDFFVCESLERIEIEYYDSELFSKLKNYCPNLKHLVFKNTTNGYVRLQWILYAVCVRWPLLQTLEIQGGIGFNMGVQNVGVHSSLRRLVLGFDCKISYEMFQVISTAFPKLVHLELYVHTYRYDTYRQGELITTQGMSYLECLNDLRHVKVHFQSTWSSLITTARQLMRCKCLHVAEFGGDLPSSIVHGLTRSCPNLRKLTIRGINNINTPDSANDFVYSLDGFTQEKLSIVMRGGDPNVWTCSEVESQIMKINTTGRPLSIEIAPYQVFSGDIEWGKEPVVVWRRIDHPSPQPSVPWYRRVISLFTCQRHL